MLYYDRIDLTEGIDVAKSNNSKKCTICHYCYFNHGFKSQKLVCNGCHSLLTLSLDISVIKFISNKSILKVKFTNITTI